MTTTDTAIDGWVGLCVVAAETPARTVRVADGRFWLGEQDVQVYNLSSTDPTPVEVVHQVDRAELPTQLDGWGTPLAISRVPELADQWRLSYAAPDEVALERICDALRATAASSEVVDQLASARRFLTSPTSLRVVLDYPPRQRRDRVGIGLEVCIDPGVFDVAAVLAGLGVADADAARLRALASGVELAPDWPARIAGLPSNLLPSPPSDIGFDHFSVSWPAGDAVVKSYLRVRPHTAPSAERRRDELVRAEGVGWTDRLSWASRQLPLLAPTSETRATLLQWQTAVDPAGTGGFDERLRRDGLDQDRALVAVSPVAGPAAEESTWWPWYQQLIEAYPGEPVSAVNGDDWLQVVEKRIPPGTAGRIPFAHLLWPVVAAAWRSLLGSAASLVVHVADSAREDLRRGLLARLSDAAAPCLSALMWETVPFGQRFLARIGVDSGEQPRARYAEFCSAQVEGALTEVFTRFPVLGSVLARVVGQWTQSVTELLVRLGNDRAAVADRFGIAATEPLTAVQGAVGDTHNDGRSVCILTFGDTRLVYKPRSVALEDLYEQLVTALSGLTPGEPLRAATALTRSDSGGRDYGYVEFITAKPCATEQELTGFYRNAGRTLALLHSLAATDCHQENLIAAGSQLVLVDAETLFDTAAPTSTRPSAAIDLDVSGADPASVLRVGMLPTWLWLEGRQTALDISALGVAPGAVDAAGVGSRGWRHVNSDAMVRGGGDTRTIHPQSLPTQVGVEGQLDNHLDTLVAGFEQTYRLLVSELAPWLRALRGQSGVLRRRTVARPTYVYASLLASSLEPAALTSGAARGLVLERLTRAFLGADTSQAWPLVAAEQDALSRLDVPYFQVPLRGGCTEWLNGRLDDWPDDEAWSRVESRVARLGESDLRWQVSLIRASVAASNYRMSADPAGPTIPAVASAPDSGPRGRSCLAAVVEAEIVVAGESSWMGLSLLPDGLRANVQSVGSGLYDGRMGLAVALAQASRADPTVDPDGRVCAAALAPLLRLLNSGEDTEVGRLAVATGLGMAGVGGLLRGLAFLRERGYGDTTEINSAESALLRALSRQLVADDRRLDLISGAAGLIAPLVRLLAAGHASRSAGQLESLIRSAADALLSRQEHDTGAWLTLPAAAPLTGLAHGAAGISLALAEAGVALAETAYLDAAVRGLDYESATYDPVARNWPDYRVTGGGDGFMMGWCAGAPGAALTRLRLLQLLPDSTQASVWRDELVAAADTTASAPLAARDHLCCGNLGRVAVLRTLSSMAPQSLLDPGWDAAANGIVAAVLTRPGEQLPRSMLGAKSDDIPMPGFFTGLPGAGLVLLDVDPAEWVLPLLL